MRIKRTFSILALFVACLFLLSAYCCEFLGIGCSSPETSDPRDDLIGRWINPAYNGADERPGKVIMTHREGDTIYAEQYDNDYDSVPLETIAMTHTDYWSESGWTYYKFTFTLSSTFTYALGRLSSDKNTLEANNGTGGYPSEVDPSGGRYGIYQRD